MIVVERGVVAAEPCCCGDPAHERPAYEAWIATDLDHPERRASTSRSADYARRLLEDAAIKFG